MSAYLLETKFDRFTIREEVEAIDPIASLAHSQLALKPFETSVGDMVDADLVITNQVNPKESLTLSFRSGK